MAVLKQLLETRQAGFTVYLPDCTQSQLWGNIDHAIHEATGFQAIHRQWIYHDVISLHHFYSEGDEEPEEIDPVEAMKKYHNVPVEDLKYGHLFGRLMFSGPCLLTIWQGADVIKTLLALKGVTHPVESNTGTIRGSFWCDNGICNLVHSSDDIAEAMRELEAVKLLHLLKEDFMPVELIPAIVSPSKYIAHSGILTVCHLVNRMIMTMRDEEAIDIQLPPSGDAKESNQQLSELLSDAAKRLSDARITGFIDAYLAGDLINVTEMMNAMPVTQWEHFVIQCGVITRYKWAST